MRGTTIRFIVICLPFSVTALNTTWTVPLPLSTAKVTHPFPLSAANRFSYSKLSVCKPSQLSPTVSWINFDSTSIRRKELNCPQMTPKIALSVVESRWNVLAYGGARKGKWKGKCRMQWVASTLHTTSEHGVSSITTVDAAHLGCQQPTELTPTGRLKWTRPFLLC